MSLNRQDIDRIARLARLSLTESEIPAYVENLSRIIALVGELVEPMAHPLPGQRQRLRADVVSSSDQHQLYQQNAPSVASGLYLVPRVIE